MSKLIIDGKEIKEPRKLKFRINQLIALKPQMTPELYDKVYKLVIRTWMDGVHEGFTERDLYYEHF
jgi:hypothetical protein